MLELYLKRKPIEVGGESFVGKQSLVALDTDHIKQYVFATDKLKEIRGASSILDNLNRRVMTDIAEKEFQAKGIYANGGSGLFLIDGDKTIAEKFGQRVQQEYRKETEGGASITFAVQEIPESIQDIENNPDLHPYMQLLHYRLLQAKGYPHQDFEVLPSHPLMRLCDACGIRYAEDKYKGESPDPDDQERRYCKVCLNKRDEDHSVKQGVERIVADKVRTEHVIHREENPFIWERIIDQLPATYKLRIGTNRPSDFNKLQGLSGGKDYLGLIYADANNMGAVMDELDTLEKREAVADLVDAAVYRAMSTAIAEHLPVVTGDEDTPFMFPFDILMIGGDDVMVVTPANVAMDVALTLAKTFHEETKKHDIRPKKEGYTLSVGVVLAPVKYPFGMLQGLSESTLKYAKKEGARMQHASNYGNTLINFMAVTGSASHDFNRVYQSLHDKHVRVSGHRGDIAFYATLRPYRVEELTLLLDTIREGKRKTLGRTKLHQVREAVLEMNLTSSVSDGIAVLRNWRAQQRDFVLQHVYTLGDRYQEAHRDAEKPGTMFPRVTFPWFADGPHAYRTSLLDFVELYDFVAQEEVDDVH